MTNIYAAIEIGTTRTVLAVGESENGGRLKAIHAEIPSSGVRKSQIIDIGNARESVRSVLREVEKRGSAGNWSVSIGNAFLVLSGQHVKADRYAGFVQVEGGRVGTDDIRAVNEATREMPLPKDRELLDIVNQDYVLDEMGGIVTPKGMAGRILKLNALHLHADRNRIQDARTACEDAHLEIREPLFATTCAAEAVLEEHERKNGVLVIDFGGGSTGYAVYLDGTLAAAEVIGVGGDHITNDIALAFQATHNQAEELKRTEASAVVGGEDDAAARATLKGTSSLMESRTVSRRALDTVVNVRLKELLGIIREKLDDLDLFNRLHAGVVLVGGGAAMKGLDALVQNSYGLSVRIGRPNTVDGFADVDAPASYAAIAGALLYAHRNYEEKPLLKNLFGELFK